MSATPAPPGPAPLSDAERARLLASVDKMIYQQVHRAGIPAADVEDRAQDLRLALWRASAAFVPDAHAKWVTFATSVVITMLRRYKAEWAEKNVLGTGPVVSLDDLAGASGKPFDPPDHRGAVSEDDADEDDGSRIYGLLADAVRKGLTAPLLDRLNDRQRELVRLIAFDGLSPAQAADQLGESETSVKLQIRNLMRTVACVRRDAEDARLEEITARREQVRALAAEGLSANAIAARIGVGVATVYVALRKIRGPKVVAAEAVRGMLRAGLTVAQIAADRRTSVTAVMKTVRKIRRLDEAAGVVDPAVPRARACHHAPDLAV